MKFKLVKKVDGEVPCYGGKTAKTGDVIELNGHFAEKAKANPDFEVVRGNTAKRKAKSTA